MAPASTAILLQAHAITPALLGLLDALRGAHPVPGAVWLLYDNSRGDLDATTRARVKPCWTFETATLWHRYQISPCRPDGPTDCLIPGNFIFSMLDFMQAHASFDWVWRVEYDVRFSGDWAMFFEAHAGCTADLLGTTLYAQSVRPDWPWWSSLETANESIAPASRVRGFFPVIRLSRRAMQRLLEAHGAGWRGHDEVLIPTVLLHRGLDVEDIGGEGAYVRPGNLNRFYMNSPVREGLSPGTFVYRHPPGGCDAGMPAEALRLPNKLYHPVKSPVA